MNKQLSIFNRNRLYFEEFLRKTNQKENISSFLISNFSAKHKRIKILSIGAGSGEDNIGFLEYLKSRNIDFEFFYFDPSKLSFNLFKEKIKRAKLLNYLSYVGFDKFELYETKEKFDIINASHVFYYLGDWEKSLNKLYAVLKNNGSAFIFIQSEDSDNFKFRNKFLKNIFGNNYAERFGEELIKIVKKLNLDCKTQKIISTLDVTNTVFKNDKISVSGKRLLSFLLRTNYNNLNNNLKSEINKYILENSEIKNKRRIFKLVDNYIIIHK